MRGTLKEKLVAEKIPYREMTETHRGCGGGPVVEATLANGWATVCCLHCEVETPSYELPIHAWLLWLAKFQMTVPGKDARS